jgi:hypothetical protein
MRLILSVLLLSSTLAVTSSARADPPSPDAARAYFDRAHAAVQRGDCAAAVPDLAQSQRLDPAWGTLLNLAYCEEQLGLIADAWRHWGDALALLPPDHLEDRQHAEERTRALDPRVPRLTLALPPGAPVGARVELDGEGFAGPGGLGVARALNPGRHTVVVTAPEHREGREVVTLAEGDRWTLTASLGPALEQPFWQRHRRSALVGGAAVVLAGVGVGLGVATRDTYGSLILTCGGLPGGCSQAQRDGVAREAVATDVLLGAAAAAAVTAGGLFFFVERKPGRPSVVVAPNQAGAMLVVRY